MRGSDTVSEGPQASERAGRGRGIPIAIQIGPHAAYLFTGVSFEEKLEGCAGPWATHT